MAKIKLNISANSKDLGEEFYDELFDMSSNGIEMYAKSDDFPMPWDAACYIDNGMFMIDGDLGQQGSHKGFAKVGIPLNKVMNYLDLSIDVDSENEEAVVQNLKAHGWL